jgi:decaprenyl-phosphate phosphoribosyltransferase
VTVVLKPIRVDEPATEPVGPGGPGILAEDLTALVERPADAARHTGRDLVTLLRPGQWAKNVLAVSVPLLDLDRWTLATLSRLGWAVVAFTIVSSIAYIINDLADRNWDRAHRVKRHRPIASGRISIPAAAVILVLLTGVLAAVLSLQPWVHSWPIAAYLVLSTAYSVALKHIPLVDVFVVALGFGLRMMEGYVVVGAAVSGWLLIGVLSLCLLLVVGKRRQELIAANRVQRPALRGYTVQLADQLMVLGAGWAAASYLLYLRTEAPLGRYALAASVLTAPLAFFALFRYLQLVLLHAEGENPIRVLLRDPVLVVNSLLWGAVSGGFLLASHLTSAG